MADKESRAIAPGSVPTVCFVYAPDTAPPRVAVRILGLLPLSVGDARVAGSGLGRDRGPGEGSHSGRALARVSADVDGGVLDFLADLNASARAGDVA